LGFFDKSRLSKWKQINMLIFWFSISFFYAHLIFQFLGVSWRFPRCYSWLLWGFQKLLQFFYFILFFFYLTDATSFLITVEPIRLFNRYSRISAVLPLKARKEKIQSQLSRPQQSTQLHKWSSAQWVLPRAYQLKIR
jgi:hypothetical protein